MICVLLNADPLGSDCLLISPVFKVLYDVRGILEKNRDTFRDDILFILKDSR